MSKGKTEEKKSIIVPGSEDKWAEFKRFYGVPYLIVGLVNPTLLIFTVPEKMPFLWIIAFYLLFGAIWPITYVTYPVFLMGLENEFNLRFVDCLTSFSCIGSNLRFVGLNILVYLAFLFPILIYVYFIKKHLKFIESIIGKPAPLISVLDRFIR